MTKTSPHDPAHYPHHADPTLQQTNAFLHVVLAVVMLFLCDVVLPDGML